MNKAAGQSAIGYVANHAVHAGVLGLQRRTRRCWPQRSFGGEKLNALAVDMFEKKDDIVVKAKMYKSTPDLTVGPRRRQSFNLHSRRNHLFFR